jgi:hypothetical protein
MLILDSRADLSLAAARGRLAAPVRAGGLWLALAAAALAAAGALALAAAVIFGPPSALL